MSQKKRAVGPVARESVDVRRRNKARDYERLKNPGSLLAGPREKSGRLLKGSVNETGEQAFYNQAGGLARTLNREWRDEDGKCHSPGCRPSVRCLEEVPMGQRRALGYLVRSLRKSGMADCCVSACSCVRIADFEAAMAVGGPDKYQRKDPLWDDDGPVEVGGVATRFQPGGSRQEEAA